MAVRKKKKTAVLLIAVLALTFLVSSPVSAGGFAAWIPMDSGTAKDLYSIWGHEGGDVFAAGSSGTILHYNGSAWRSMNSGTTHDLHSIWGTEKNDVFAVGGSGTILHYNGFAWNSMNSGITEDLHGIWGFDGADVFAVGKSGIILRYDGSAWGAVDSGTEKDLNCVWGLEGTGVLAAGSSGTILHYDGFEWSAMSSGTTHDLHSIWGDGSTGIFAAGKMGTILYSNGSIWSSKISGTTGDLYGIWGADGSNVFAVGGSGNIVYYDGSKFSPMNRNTNNMLHVVLGFSSIDVFAVGASGTILQYIPPVLNSISRDRGEQGETLNVIITGTNLSGTGEVRFGSGIAVNSFSVLNPNQITASITIVAGAVTGTRDISVTTPGGNFTLPGSFTVKQALPTITSVSPDQERQGTNQNVTITGTNLTAASEVQFGAGIAVNSFSVLSSNQISANITITAGAATGTRDISVTAAGGSFTLPDAFTVKQALPAIASISPDQGNQETTFNVTINGLNLAGTSEVYFGAGVTVNSFTVLSSNQISASISVDAGAEKGARNVLVTTPGGSFSLPDAFTVKQALPVITAISPDNGSQGAALNVILTGTHFTGAGEVRLGAGIAVTGFNVLSSSQITAVIIIMPGAEAGVRDVSVTTPGGSFSLFDGFTVKQAPPVISSVSPDGGTQGTTLSIIISGSNLAGATSVSFGTGAAVQSFTNLSPTQLRVNLAIDEKAVVGWRDVSVTTPGGSSTLGNSFNIKERSTATLFVALLWVIIAAVVVLFSFILHILRKNRAGKL